MNCKYCEENLLPERKTIEHFIPRAKNGKNSVENRVLYICLKCNNSKHNLLPWAFIMDLREAIRLGNNYANIKLDLLPIVIKNMELLMVEKLENIDNLFEGTLGAKVSLIRNYKNNIEKLLINN